MNQPTGSRIVPAIGIGMVTWTMIGSAALVIGSDSVLVRAFCLGWLALGGYLLHRRLRSQA